MSLNFPSMISSLQTQRLLSLHGSHLQKTIERLSSGLRINSAKDDAAGLSISQRLLTQVRGLSVAGRNTNDGISLLQTAEGSLGKIGDMLQRMRALAVQSANATNSTADRQTLQAEVVQMRNEIDRIAQTTGFNGQRLLDGSFGGSVFQVGPNVRDNITIGEIGSARMSQLGQHHWSQRSLDINTAAMHDLSAIDAGKLGLRMNGRTLDLGPIGAANSTSERMGQLVAAINARTPDTGVTALIQGQQLVLQAPGASNAPTFSLLGFELSQTGLQMLPMGRPVATGDYEQYILALEDMYALSINGLMGAPAYPRPSNPALATESEARAYRDAVREEYARFYAGGFSLDGFHVTRNGQSVILANDMWSDGQLYANVEHVVLTFLDSGIGASLQLDAQGRLQNGQGLYLKGLVEAVLSGDNVPITGPLDSVGRKIGEWARLARTEDIAEFRDPPPETFEPGTYNGAQLVQEVNHALLGSQHPPVSAEDIWGPQASQWMTLDGNGQPTGWAGSNSTEKMANATAAWKAAELFLADRGGLGLRGEQDRKSTSGLRDLDISTQAGAIQALGSLDSALDAINRMRGHVGAWQNRFEAAAEVIAVQHESFTAAHARIVDADFALEMANFSRYQILQQVAGAMLAQANQMPRWITALLGSKD